MYKMTVFAPDGMIKEVFTSDRETAWDLSDILEYCGVECSLIRNANNDIELPTKYNRSMYEINWDTDEGEVEKIYIDDVEYDFNEEFKDEY